MEGQPDEPRVDQGRRRRRRTRMRRSGQRWGSQRRILQVWSSDQRRPKDKNQLNSPRAVTQLSETKASGRGLVFFDAILVACHFGTRVGEAAHEHKGIRGQRTGQHKRSAWKQRTIFECETINGSKLDTKDQRVNVGHKEIAGQPPETINRRLNKGEEVFWCRNIDCWRLNSLATVFSRGEEVEEMQAASPKGTLTDEEPVPAQESMEEATVRVEEATEEKLETSDTNVVERTVPEEEAPKPATP
ncbi:hypothetical protein RF55_8602 [Lasius niger]|uniref:Uncharacterized protein n=1 Tax=Lasius niger TaxID=67767 RepID=A0A0J7KMI9_LASNI|nr:hypothetical protein RF55_8602 [Lasius niger]